MGGEDTPLWLFFLLIMALGVFWGSRFVIDAAQFVTLKVEVRSATQSAASAAFSTVDLESMGERELVTDKAHRILILDKVQAAIKFRDALKNNLNLDDQYKPLSGMTLDGSRQVIVKNLQIFDSADVPVTYDGIVIDEPMVIVNLILPVDFYSTKKDTFEVIRKIPIRTFITNWQK